MALKDCRHVSRQRISLLQAGIDLEDVQAKLLYRVINRYLTALKLLSYRSLSIDNLCDVHRAIYVGGGRIRTTQNWVGESLENASYVPPAPELLPEHLQNWLSFTNKVSTLEQCIESYARFLSIHPFGDGNGRFARALFERLKIECGATDAHLMLFRLNVPASRYRSTLSEFTSSTVKSIFG